METFNEIFEKAQNTADKRKKVFNELRRQLNNVIFPKVKETLTQFEKNTLILTSNEPFFQDQTPYNDNRMGWSITIDFNDGDFCTNHYNYFTHTFERMNNPTYYKVNEISNKYLINFIESLQKRLIEFLRYKENEITKAKELIS
jgi:hypothetical protein